MHLNAIRDLLEARSFALGLAFGGVAFLIAALAAVSSRRRLPDIAGVAFVAASWLGVRGAWGPSLASRAVALGLLILAVGGAVAAFIVAGGRVAPRYASLTTAIALTPGAIVLAVSTPLAGSTTSRIVLACATIGIGVAIRDFDKTKGARGAPWLLFAVAAGGVYLAVPDTELARVMLGVAVPFVLLSIPRPLSPFGPAGSAAIAGLFAWVVVVGGRGRPGSVVGGLAAIGVLAAEPLGRRVIGNRTLLAREGRHRSRDRMAPQHDRNQDAWLTAALVAAIAQLLIALYASRVVGRRDGAVGALLILAPMVVLAVVVTPELYPKARRSRRHRRPGSSESRHHERLRQ